MTTRPDCFRTLKRPRRKDEHHMATGPVEYIIVAFPGNKFTGQIAPELIALVESGTVRILDLIFIGKEEDGSVLAFEIDELDGVDAFDQLEGEFGGLIGPKDIEF